MALTFSLAESGASIDDPRGYLWKDPRDEYVLSQNTTNYDLLVGSFSRSDFVSFTGAGISKDLGIDDWEKLIDELFTVARSEGFEESKPSEKDKYPEYIERLFSHLKSKSRQGSYFDTIRARMAPRISSTSLTLIYLSLCVDVHVTTNFDRSLERAYACVDYLRGYFIKGGNHPQPQLCYIGNLNTHSSGPTIVYLHGSESENIYILKKSDYERFYPSVSNSETEVVTEVEDCLRHYYRSKSILFIGFSFEDPYLRKYFFNLAKEMEREEESKRKFFSEAGKSVADKKMRHFILVDENNTFVSDYKRDIFSELQKYNLYPIIYKTGQHIFLEHLFKIFVNGNRGML